MRHQWSRIVLPRIMNSKEVRQNFLMFFQAQGHKIVPSASLIPEDSSVLLTTAGMQPFKKYFLGSPSLFGSRVTSCQKCFRTSDIDQVGDATHLTFLEMLGNFSFGDYFKEEAMSWAVELITHDYNIPLNRLYFTYFKGDEISPADSEAKEIWIKLGAEPNHILAYGREDNFWGPTGDSGPCGPTAEIHYDLTGQACNRAENCYPGCSCGRFVELWNIVFNQYHRDKDGQMTELIQGGIDTGMGLERLSLAVQGKSSIFETDLFWPVIERLFSDLKEYNDNSKPYRIIADHLRGLLFLTIEGIKPSNVERGYVMRRIIRRLLESASILKLDFNQIESATQLLENQYAEIYPELIGASSMLGKIIAQEDKRMSLAVKRGMAKISRQNMTIDGREAFRLYSTYGLSPQELKNRGYQFDESELINAIEEHKEISRRGAENKFGGHGVIEETSAEERQIKARLHTATHLLQSALNQILSTKISQKGSDITTQRLRFDFSFDRALSKNELNQVSALINHWINDDLRIEKESISFKKALSRGDIIIEGKNYPEEVDVYAIINGDGTIISREVCAGPHVNNTGEIGQFQIIKEESSSAGVRRIKAVLENGQKNI